MERPNIKSGPILDYVVYLEKQIESTLIYTKKKLNRGIQRQVDFLADELLREDFKLSLTSDVEVDRFLKIIKEANPIILAMEKFESQSVPKDEGDAGPKLKEGSVAEKYIFDK